MAHILTSMLRLAQKQRIPISTTIELLARCNLRCGHCYVTHERNSDLTSEVVATVLEELHELGGLTVAFTGGEIALRPDLFELIAVARERWFAVDLFSSGTLWREAEWDRIAGLGVSQVQLSIYGTSAEMHDATTGVAGSHRRTLATARGLVARGVEVRLAALVTVHNTREIPGVFQLADDLGVTVNFDWKIQVTDQGDPTPKALQAPYDSLVELFADPAFHERMKRAEYSPLAETGPGTSVDPDGRPCTVGESGLFIRCNGDVLPCARWPVAAGNVLADRLSDIWRHSPALRRARELRNANLPACTRCAERAACGRCPGMNLSETGDVGLPSTTTCLAAAALAEARRRRRTV